MGLDMSLTGEAHFFESAPIKPIIAGFEDLRTKSVKLELGDWCKHPDLHGYIVETFAEGVDECQAIELNTEMIDQIIEAVKKNEFDTVEGFFFGVSDDHRSEEGIQNTIEILEKAKDFLSREIPNPGTTWLSIKYQASW